VRVLDGLRQRFNSSMEEVVMMAATNEVVR
jgi:hypothetical protein